MPTKGARDHWPPQRVRAERERAGLSQDDLAALMGVSKSAVSFWENGKTAISRLNMAKLARLFLDGEKPETLESRINSLEDEVRELRTAVRVLQLAVVELGDD